MKKILLSLFLSFIAVNAFAATPKEILEKAFKADVQNYHYDKTFTTEYEFSSTLNRGTVVECKETVDGANVRQDSKLIGQKGEKYYSVIINDAKGYISGKYTLSGGEPVFKDYMVLSDTDTYRVRTLAIDSKAGEELNKKISETYFEKITREYKGVEAGQTKKIYDFEASFDSEIKKDDEYVILYGIKDKVNAIKEYKAEYAKNHEDANAGDDFFSLAGADLRFYINKKSFFITQMETVISKIGMYENMRGRKEFDELPEEEKRKLVEEAAEKTMKFKAVFSDYRKIPGTKYHIPWYSYIETSSNMGTKGPQIIFLSNKTKSYEALKSSDVDPEIFKPSNIKKGEGKLPNELTYEGDMFGYLFEQIRKEMGEEFKNSFKEAIKESAKEAAKEEGKNLIKKGIGGAFKGLSGF